MRRFFPDAAWPDVIKGNVAGQESLASIVRRRAKTHALDLLQAVCLLQMRIGFHQQRAAVLVAKPVRDGGDVHAAFDGARCEVMTQGMMMEIRQAEIAAGRLNALARRRVFHDERIRRNRAAFALYPLQQ